MTSWTAATRLLCPWTFPGKNTGVGISSRDLPNPGIKLMSPALAGELLTTRPPGKSLSSVQFSCSVMSDSLWPHELQHARPPCPSPTPGVYPNSCASSRWCHPTISSSVVPFSSCPQFCPASGSSQMSQLFTSGGQSIGVPALASVLPMNIQDWSPLGWTGGSPCCPRDSQESIKHHSSKASILWCSAFFIVQLSRLYMTTGKNHRS